MITYLSISHDFLQMKVFEFEKLHRTSPRFSKASGRTSNHLHKKKLDLEGFSSSIVFIVFRQVAVEKSGRIQKLSQRCTGKKLDDFLKHCVSILVGITHQEIKNYESWKWIDGTIYLIRQAGTSSLFLPTDLLAMSVGQTATKPVCKAYSPRSSKAGRRFWISRPTDGSKSSQMISAFQEYSGVRYQVTLPLRSLPFSNQNPSKDLSVLELRQ